MGFKELQMTGLFPICTTGGNMFLLTALSLMTLSLLMSGPLLFLLYINDFSNCSNLFDLHIFADDTNLFYSNHSLTELEAVINNNLKYVSNWLMVNKLSLNVGMTNFIIFHPPQKSTSHIVKLPSANKQLNRKNVLNI